MELKIAHLYPDLLNIYGDRGNIICLKQRCLWRGIKVKVNNISVKDALKPKTHDLFFGGGGQDRQQLIVAQDLQKKKAVLKAEANRGVPMLTICGTYQLFGLYFKTHQNKKIPGIGIFNMVTIASNQRKIGNIVIQPNMLKQKMVGFENHSGNTFIDLKQKVTRPLGRVIKGFGNNGSDRSEGGIYNNVFGTYLHGPVLPKNPHLADLLIKLALELKYKKEVTLQPLDDQLERQAHQAACKRNQ